MVILVTLATDVLISTGLGCVRTSTIIVSLARLVFSRLGVLLPCVSSSGRRGLDPMDEYVLEVPIISEFKLMSL